jgi:hypothetical protein
MTDALAHGPENLDRGNVRDDIVSARCEAASALSDLALHNLRSRGLRRTDTDFEEQYILEIAAVSATYGLPYYDKEA